ncbi:Gag-like protein, partial [Operophtera brumata]
MPTNTASDGGEESDCSNMSVSSCVSTTSQMRRVAQKRTRKPDKGATDIEGSKRTMYLKDTIEDDVFDPSVPPSSSKTKLKLPKIDDLGKEMEAQPTKELGTCIKVQLETIEKMADKSKNLRGDYVHGLRLAVRKVQAAVIELAQRTSTDANVERLERENAELRAQMADLSTKVEKLTESIHKQANSQASAVSVTKQAASPPAVGGIDWEGQFMERIGALMDRKLAAANIAQFSPALGSVGSSVPGPSSKGPSVKGKAKGKRLSLPAMVATLPAVQSRLTEVQMPLASTSSWATVVVTKAGKKPEPTRLPNSAAITVTIPKDSEVTLASVMAAAKQRIKLSDVGVDTVRSKKAITGALIMEVSGPDCGPKADALAERMRVALADMGVRIVRPVKMAELRLKDLDDSVTPEEVAAAVAKAGSCSVDDVRVGDIRRLPTTLGTVWVRCPLVAVRKLAAAKHVVVGWVSARVDYLTSRPLQCFRCLEYGHVRSMCQSTVDRGNLCYACGEPGHLASKCTRPRRCPLCSDLGCKADHRMGSKRCSPPRKSKR